MKVIYIHQYFKTPEQGGGIRSWHLARALSQAGYDVEVITAHNEKHYQEVIYDQVKVHYLPVYYENKLDFYGRGYSFLKYSFQAFRLAFRMKGINICYISSTPLTTGLIGVLLKMVRRIPFIFEVRDLWPEAPFQMGFVKNKILRVLLRFLERIIYKNASEIVALSPGIKEGILKSLPSGRSVELIPNFSDCEFFAPYKKDTEFLEHHEINSEFTIAYTGAFGKANNMDFLLNIIQSSHAYFGNRVHFFLAGEGAEKAQLVQRINKEGFTNATVLGMISKKEINRILNISDASLISFAPVRVLETTSPNKFFDALAAGKICITNTKGWIKDLIEEHQIGFYCDPECPEDFVKKLKYYFIDLEKRERAKNNSRKLAESRFSLDIMKVRFLKLFEKYENSK